MANGQISDDGYWVWDGSNWIPRIQHEDLSPEYEDSIQSLPLESNLENQVSARAKEYKESNHSNSQKYTIGLVFVVLLIGLMFLLSEENSDYGLEQTWYNSNDEMDFDSDGTYSTSIGLSDNWEQKDGFLYLNISGEKSPWKYLIDSNHSDDYDILFFAPYPKDEGDDYHTNPDTQKCRIYFSKQITNLPDIAELVKHTTPTWCEPYEYLDLVDMDYRHCSSNFASIVVNSSGLNFTYIEGFDVELCDFQRYEVHLNIVGGESHILKGGQNSLYSQLYSEVVIGFGYELSIQCDEQIEVVVKHVALGENRDPRVVAEYSDIYVC